MSRQSEKYALIPSEHRGRVQLVEAKPRRWARVRLGDGQEALVHARYARGLPGDMVENVELRGRLKGRTWHGLLDEPHVAEGKPWDVLMEKGVGADVTGDGIFSKRDRLAVISPYHTARRYTMVPREEVWLQGIWGGLTTPEAGGELEDAQRLQRLDLDCTPTLAGIELVQRINRNIKREAAYRYASRGAYQQSVGKERYAQIRRLGDYTYRLDDMVVPNSLRLKPVCTPEQWTRMDREIIRIQVELVERGLRLGFQGHVIENRFPDGRLTDAENFVLRKIRFLQEGSANQFLANVIRGTMQYLRAIDPRMAIEYLEELAKQLDGKTTGDPIEGLFAKIRRRVETPLTVHWREEGGYIELEPLLQAWTRISEIETQKMEAHAREVATRSS